MSPRDFVPSSVLSRLTRIRELLDHLEYIGDLSAEQLREDPISRLAVERILTQLVELAVDINQHIAVTVGNKVVPDYETSFAVLPELDVLTTDLVAEIRGSVRLRNVLVHQYLDIDLSIVSSSTPRARKAFTRYVEEMALWLKQRGDPL